jgi:hypothetical protein
MSTQLRSEQTEFGGAWGNWTVDWVNLIVGNGTVTAKYIQIGKTVHGRITVKLGSTSQIQGAVTFNLPVTSVLYGGLTHTIGTVGYLENGVGGHSGALGYASPTRAYLWAISAGGTYAGLTSLSNVKPFTWGTDDEIGCSFTYEAA